MDKEVQKDILKSDVEYMVKSRARAIKKEDAGKSDLGMWGNILGEGGILGDKSQGPTFESMLETKKDSDVYGSSIPFMYSLIGNLVYNNSTVSISTFLRMAETDNILGAGLEYMVNGIASRIGRFTHPVKEVEKFVNTVLDELKQGKDKLFKDMALACCTGFSITELIWDTTDLGHVVTDALSLPPETVIFEVDAEGRITDNGILQYVYVYSPAFLQNLNGLGTMGGVGLSPLQSNPTGSFVDPWSSVGDVPIPLRTPVNLPVGRVAIPKDKVLHYRYNRGDLQNNPYGGSPLRRAHAAFIIKYAILELLPLAVDRRAASPLNIYVDPRAKVQVGTNSSTGEAVTRDLIEEMASVAEDVHSTTAFLIPSKKGEAVEIDTNNMTGDLSIYKEALDFCNNELKNSFLVQSGLWGDSSGSYASDLNKSSIFNEIIMGKTKDVCDLAQRSFISQLIEKNFLPEEHKGVKGSLKIVSQTIEDAQIQAKTFETLTQSGYMSPDDLEDVNHVRETVGLMPLKKLPPRVTIPPNSTENRGVNPRDAKQIYKNQETGPQENQK